MEFVEVVVGTIFTENTVEGGRKEEGCGGVRAKEERQGGCAYSSQRVWEYMALYSHSYRLESKDVCEHALALYTELRLYGVLVVVIYRSARAPMNRFNHSLLPLLPSPPLARGDPIDRRRCQSLHHSRPEPQLPVPPSPECQHTPHRRDH